MLSEKFKNSINSYQDFPKEGILFRDISPLLINPELFEDLISSMIKNPMFKLTDAIIAIDARGFIYGTAIALRLKKPLILARKQNKLPGELIEKEYGLEYGKDKLTIQKDSILKLEKFVIVDDLLATGGTAKCVSEMLIELKKEVLGLSVVVELTELEGKNKFSFPVSSEIKY